MDSITSLSAMYNRGPKKVSNMGDIRIWRNYLVFACCTHPKTPPSRSESPDQDGGSVLYHNLLYRHKCFTGIY